MASFDGEARRSKPAAASCSELCVARLVDEEEGTAAAPLTNSNGISAAGGRRSAVFVRPCTDHELETAGGGGMSAGDNVL